MNSRIIELNPNSLPFIPSCEQAIYIESDYDESINSFIIDNYAEISSAFHKRKIDFCYLPVRCKERSAELLNYHNPSSKCDVKSTFTTEEFVHILFNGRKPDSLKSSVIIYNKICRCLYFSEYFP